MEEFIQKLKSSKDLQDQLKQALMDLAKKNGVNIDEKEYAASNNLVGCVSTAWTAVCTV
ncbi:Nif11-like leader peptide family natural product precursor [Flavobacterium sp.]|uniref:Nif11-like leader peptide family natural product precursor n=1 Tax=Flavobacterium sp. TaxID=239 RepID=UPI00261522C9|nr:Nif11-like leader peptide family natural product precursor [Flavobacterium sp.]